MAIPTAHGVGLMEVMMQDIAPIRLSYSPHGTGPTLRFLRYIDSPSHWTRPS